jgi:hypothetical protein
VSCAVARISPAEKRSSPCGEEVSRRAVRAGRQHGFPLNTWSISRYAVWIGCARWIGRHPALAKSSKHQLSTDRSRSAPDPCRQARSRRSRHRRRRLLTHVAGLRCVPCRHPQIHPRRAGGAALRSAHRSTPALGARVGFGQPGRALRGRDKNCQFPQNRRRRHVHFIPVSSSSRAGRSSVGERVMTRQHAGGRGNAPAPIDAVMPDGLGLCIGTAYGATRMGSSGFSPNGRQRPNRGGQ